MTRNEYELADALRFAEYRGVLHPGDAAACCNQGILAKAERLTLPL